MTGVELDPAIAGAPLMSYGISDWTNHEGTDN